jgi:ribosomal protein L7/L12
MELYGIVMACIVGTLGYIEVSKLKKIIKNQGKQINQLAKVTGNKDLVSYLISDELKEELTLLKKSGKMVDAVKKIREETQMDLVEAKQYVDNLK